jgi:hypothetical protein
MLSNYSYIQHFSCRRLAHISLIPLLSALPDGPPYLPLSMPLSQALCAISSTLLRIVAPILQAPITLAARVVLRFLLLREMAFAVRDHAAHVGEVVLVVFRGVLLWVFAQDVNYLSPTRLMGGSMSEVQL